MGVLETLLLLGGLGGAMYFGVYYLIPAMQQMAYAPLYYAQAQAQQQQPPPAAPAPAPAPAPETPAPAVEETPAADTTTEEPATTTDTIEDTVEDVLEDAGLVKEAPKEKEDKETTRKKSAETNLKASNAEQKKKRAEYDAATDPKKDTRSKEELARAQKAAGFFTQTTTRINKRRYVYYNEDGTAGYYYDT